MHVSATMPEGGGKMYAGSKVTILVPTVDEAENIGPLVEDVKTVTPNRPVRMFFIDDSSNKNTVRAIEEAARRFGSPNFQVDYFHREGEELWGSLSGAIVDGFRRSEGVLLAMDGDGQHTAETIPMMLAAMNGDKNVLIMASRYCPGGSNEGLSGPLRRFVSWASTKLAKILFPTALRGVSDPMTGFFALHLEAIELERLQAQGFKILLEILVTHPHLIKREVPLVFAERKAGDSKGTLRQGLEFIQQLLRLRMSTSNIVRPAYKPVK